MRFVRKMREPFIAILPFAAKILDSGEGHTGVIIDEDRLSDIVGRLSPSMSNMAKALQWAHFQVSFGWMLTKSVVGFDSDFCRSLEQSAELTFPISKFARLDGNPIYFHLNENRVEHFHTHGILVSAQSLKTNIPSDENKYFVLLDFILFANALGREVCPHFRALISSPDDSITSTQIEQSLENAIRSQIGFMPENLLRGFGSKLLYWLSDMPDASEARESIPKPRLKRIKKKGLTLFAAERAHVSILGKQFGDEMRAWRERNANRSSDPNRTVRPHIRRAHWHTYLYGPRSAEERERKVLWIPPVFVHSTKPEEQSI